MYHTAPTDISKSIASGIAITCLILILSVYTPIGFVCSFLIPLPVLFFRSKLGRTGGIIVSGTSIILMVVFLRKVFVDMLFVDVLFFAELLLIGFILSELIEFNLSVEKTILYVCIFVMITGTLGILLYSGMSNKGVIDLLSDYITKNLEFVLALYKQMEAPQENITRMAESLENIKYFLVRITPSLIVASTLFVTWTSLLLARPLLKSKNLFYPDFGRLNLWKAPEYLVWGVIGCGGMLLLPDKSIRIFSLNGMIILMTIYFFAGIAIISFYFEKKGFPRIVRVILYSVIAFQQIMLLVVIGLGFFDIWLNFRKLKEPEKKSSPGKGP